MFWIFILFIHKSFLFILPNKLKKCWAWKIKFWNIILERIRKQGRKILQQCYSFSNHSPGHCQTVTGQLYGQTHDNFEVFTIFGTNKQKCKQKETPINITKNETKIKQKLPADFSHPTASLVKCNFQNC